MKKNDNGVEKREKVRKQQQQRKMEEDRPHIECQLK